jgi:valyl-tRNA synthetase
VTAALEAFRFDEAANALYAFFWSEFCDGYVEMVKRSLRDESVSEGEKAKTRAVLRRVLLDSLAMLHPFMPFVSCEIREALNGDGMKLPVARFPEADGAWADDGAVRAVEVLRAVVTRVRNLRAENGLAQTEPLSVGIELAEGPLSKELKRHVPLLGDLARLRSVEVSPEVRIAGAFRDAVAGVGLVVELPAKEASSGGRDKLRQEIEKVHAEAERVRARLADEAFLSRAPAAVVEKSRRQLEELEERRARLAGNLAPAGGR